MRVCHVTSIHQRYDTRIFQKECISLYKAGYEVFLLVNDENDSEVKNGVQIISTGKTFKNRIDRFINLKQIMFSALMEIAAEIYHFHDPDLLPIALLLKKKRKDIKIVFDSHEDFPAQIKGKTWIPVFLRGIISYCYKKYQDRCLKVFDGVISVSPDIVEKLKKVNSKTKLVTNYPILLCDEEVCRETGAERSICFAGGISEQWGHKVILDAIQNLNVKYILCGVADKEYLDELKNKSAWKKVDYRGRVPFEEVKEIYQSSQIGMTILQYSANTGGTKGTLGNTKLFECMHAGVPVICTDFIYWKEIVEKNHCGVCVNPYDSEQVHNAIKYLLNNPEEAMEMGNNGRRLVQEKYNWDIQAKELLGLYCELIEK